MSQRFSKFVCLDWYDGPLRSIRRVDFVGEHPSESLVEVRTTLARVVGNDYYMRLSREDLVQMLALLDGKPVEDFHDGLVDVAMNEPCRMCEGDTTFWHTCE